LCDLDEDDDKFLYQLFSVIQEKGFLTDSRERWWNGFEKDSERVSFAQSVWRGRDEGFLWIRAKGLEKKTNLDWVNSKVGAVVQSIVLGYMIMIGRYKISLQNFILNQNKKLFWLDGSQSLTACSHDCI
jgi:hypothetical protein